MGDLIKRLKAGGLDSEEITGAILAIVIGRIISIVLTLGIIWLIVIFIKWVV